MNEQTIEKKKKRRSIIAAFMYALGVILAILLISWEIPEPEDELQGVVIDFGAVSAASGYEEPSIQENVATPPSQATPEPEPVEEVETETPTDLEQTYEETVKIEEKEEEQEEPVKEPEKEPEPVKEPVKEPDDAKEPAKEPVKEPEEVIDPNATYNPSGKNPNENESPGQGTNPDAPPGNEGDPTGEMGGGSAPGSGFTGNSGVGADLAGRDIMQLPNIQDNTQKTGTVKLEIVVDKNGRVIDAKYTPFGSSTQDQELIKKAIKAAKWDTKFTPSDIEFQRGFMTFTFRLK